MDTQLYSVLETGIVALVVLACAYAAFGKFAPKTRMRLQSGLGLWLAAPGRAGWMQSVGRRLAADTPAGGCGDGCGACSNCGPADPKTIKVHKR